MNPYFQQLPIKIDMLDQEKFDLTPGRSFDRVQHVTSSTPTYYSRINNPEYAVYLNNIFKELNPRDVYFCQFKGSAPHIDHDNSKCAINHYYTTQDASTIFYNPVEGAVPYCGANETTANYYKKEDVIEADKFCAEKNSVYILNVSRIHGLDFPQPYGPLRQFIKWRFDAPYEEIYDKLFNEIIPKLNKL